VFRGFQVGGRSSLVALTDEGPETSPLNRRSYDIFSPLIARLQSSLFVVKKHLYRDNGMPVRPTMGRLRHIRATSWSLKQDYHAILQTNGASSRLVNGCLPCPLGPLGATLPSAKCLLCKPSHVSCSPAFSILWHLQRSQVPTVHSDAGAARLSTGEY